MSDLNITIKIFDRGIPDQIDAEDKVLVEFRDDFGKLQRRSDYLSLEEFMNYKEDRFSKLGVKERQALIRTSKIESRVSVTWFREPNQGSLQISQAKLDWKPVPEHLLLFLGGARRAVVLEEIGLEYFLHGGEPKAILEGWEPRLDFRPFRSLSAEIRDRKKNELSEWLGHFEAGIGKVFRVESSRLTDQRPFWKIPDNLAVERLNNRHSRILDLIRRARESLQGSGEEFLSSYELSRLQSFCDFQQYRSLAPNKQSITISRRFSTPEFEEYMESIARKALTE